MMMMMMVGLSRVVVGRSLILSGKFVRRTGTLRITVGMKSGKIIHLLCSRRLELAFKMGPSSREFSRVTPIIVCLCLGTLYVPDR